MDIPTLTTDRLVLRGLRASDDYAAMNADPEVRRWLSGTLLTREQAWEQMASFLGQWALRGYGIFAVESEGRFAGRVGLLHFVDWPEPELSWTLASSFWGRGLATEITRTCLDVAHERLRLSTVVGVTTPDNLASQHVLEKNGLVYERDFMLDTMLMRLFRKNWV